MTELVVVVPSRGRPQAVAELATACNATCAAKTVLLVVLDTDDPTAPEYAAPAGTTVFFTHTQPAGHVGAINAGALRALQDFHPFAIAKLDDDHRPRTKGWDQRYVEALRDLGTGVVYGNDLLQGEKLPTAPALTADIVETLGYMGPPQLRHLFVDNFWLDLGTATRIRYLPDVVVEHMHPVAGKSDWTEGHRRVNAPQQYETDSAAYGQYRAAQFEADVAKVRALLR